MLKNTKIFKALAKAYTNALSSKIHDTKGRNYVPYTMDGKDGYFAFNVVNHTICTDKVGVYDDKMEHLYDILYLNFE